MIPVLSVCGKDADLAVRLLQWCADLDGKDSLPNLHIVAEYGINIEEVVNTAATASQKVDVHRYEPWTGNHTWPWPQNYAWQTVAREIMPTLGQPWFWWEPDVTPLCKGWWQALCDEYTKGGKPFMGHVVPHLGHMNGAAFYPPDVSKHCLSGLLVHDIPFDSAMGREIRGKVHVANHLMGHYVKGTDRAGVHIDNLDAFRSMCDGIVVYHGCSDNSLIDLLRDDLAKGNRTVFSKAVSKVAEVLKPKVRPPPSIATTPAAFWQVKYGTWNPLWAPPKPKDFKRLDLREVSLWAAVWTHDARFMERTVRVLNYCNSFADFHETILFSCMDVPKDFRGVVIQIPVLDAPGWSLFVNRITPLAFHGNFAMSVHEDGFPMFPWLWKNEFLSVDYIGAPWCDALEKRLNFKVGNGGFCIESRKFFQAKLLMPFEKRQVDINADYLVCNIMRDYYDKLGCVFAPVHLALEFSTEGFGNQWPSFGFHGRRICPEKYEHAWKIIEST